MEFAIIDRDPRRFRCSLRRLFETIYDQKNEQICLAIALADALTVTFRMKYVCMVDFSPQPLLERRVSNFIEAKFHLLRTYLGLQQHSNYQFIHIAGLPNYQTGHHYTLKDLKLVFGYNNIVKALKKNFGPWGPRYPIVAWVKMDGFTRDEALDAWTTRTPFRREEDCEKEAVVFTSEDEKKAAEEAPGHALIITGLDTSSLYDDEHVLEVKNSWGIKWGAGGYSIVTYHFIQQLLIPVLRGDVEEVDKHHHPLELNSVIGHENSINGISFSDDGHYLAAACDDGVVRIFHMDDALSISFKCTEFSLEAKCHPIAVAFVDDDASVVVACKSDVRKGSSLYLYGKDNSSGGDDSSKFHLKNEVHATHNQNQIVSLYGAKVGGSNILVSSSEGTDIILWEGKSVTRLGIADTLQGKNSMAAVSPNGRYVAAATSGHDVQIWKIEYVLDASLDFKQVKAVTKVKSLIGHQGAITWLCFTNDSNEIISASMDGTVRVWNIIKGSHENVTNARKLKELPPSQDSKVTTSHYDHLSVSPDGKIVAVSQNYVLQWLSFESGEVLDTADNAHEGDITNMAWAPNPIRAGDEHVCVLATLDVNKKMKLWKAPALDR